MSNKIKALIAVLVLIALSSLSFSLWTVLNDDGDDTVLTPDYAPEPEEDQHPFDDDSEEETSEGEGGSVGLIYGAEVNVDLSEKEAYLIFGNPSRSNKNVVLQIIIQDKIIVQSGTITPGNRVTKLDLLDGAEKLLEKGGYDGKFKVLFYDIETGQRSVIDTDIIIKINVQR